MRNINKNEQYKNTNKGKKSHRIAKNGISIFIVGVFLALFLFSTVSAFEFDNVKSFDKIQNKISIDNMFGFGGTIVDYTLTSNTDYCLVDCSAEGIANLYSSGQLFQDINFKDKSGKDKEVSYKIYINDGVKTFDRNVPISYKEVCSDKTFINGSKECSLVPDKYEKQTVEETNWKEYKGEALLVGNYKWKIEGSKGEDQSVDWIASAFGKDLTEWAWWSSGYDDLLSYYKLDEITGTTAVDSYGSNNGTATNPALFSGAAVGIINQSTDFTAGDYYIDLGNTAFNFDTSVDTFGFSLWVKTATTGVTERFFGKDNETDKQYSLYFHYTDILKFNVYDSGLSTDMTLEYSTDIRDNNWHHIVITGNGTTNLMYVDNVLRDSDTGLVPSATTTNPTVIGTSATQYFSGYVDEVGIWNRTLSSTEVDNLWNGGLGLEFESPNEITTTSNAPVDYYNTTSNSITFNCSATDDVGILNLTLMIDGIDNNTVLGGVGQNLSLEVTRSLSEGSHNWSCRGTDGTGAGGDPKLSDTRFLKIDSTNPELNITYPTTAIPYWVSGNNLTINYTASDSNLDSCWYSFDLGATNQSVSCGTNITQNITNIGQNNITLYANDSLGNEATDYQSWSYNVLENSRTYNITSVITTLETFDINISTDGTQTAIVYLNYNGTRNLATDVNGIYRTNISVNDVGTNTFFWNISYGISYIITYSSTQEVADLTDIVIASGACPPGLSKVLNFTFIDATNLTNLGNFDVDYNFKYGISNYTSKVNYGNINTTELSVCLNTTESESYYIGFGEVDYSKTGFSERRYYMFSGTRVTNETTYIPLYALPSSDSTSFLIEVREPSLSPYINKYTTLLRWYPNLNEYKIVEMGRTDDKGQTVNKVKIEDVDYRVGVYDEDGSLIYLAEPIRMVCLVSPCSYTLNVKDRTGYTFNDIYNIEADITYEDGIFQLIYNDPSQKTSLMQLLVYQIGGSSSDTLICSANSTAFTGIINCDVSSSSGTLKAVARRSASPAYDVALKIIDTVTSVFQGTFGLFIQFLISVTLILAGVVSPVVAIVLGIFSLVIGTFVFRVMSFPIFIGIALLGVLVINFMRRTAP